MKLTSKGRSALSPNDSSAYIIPDILEGIQQIDAREDLTEEEKIGSQEQIADDKIDVALEKLDQQADFKDAALRRDK